MKIAVTTDGDQIFQHFGKCPTFTIFTAENGVVNNKTTVDTGENGHGALAGFLKANRVDAVICGGIGGGAKQMLASAGIKLVSGIEGNIDQAVASYLSGDLNDMGGACSSHEEHSHDHTCNCANHCN